MSEMAERFQVELEVNGKPHLDVREVEIVERLSGLFHCRLRARSSDAQLDFESVVGKEAQVVIRAEDGSGERRFRGVVSHAEQERAVTGGHDVELSSYFFHVSPSLWLARLGRNHRVFQHLSVPDIVEKVISAYGESMEWRLSRESYPKLWLRVQYGESDFDFVSRLLEEAGITYAFIDGKLFFGDKLSETAFFDRGTLPYHQQTEGHRAGRFAQAAGWKSEPRPTENTSLDYDLRRPSYQLSARSSSGAGPRIERFDYLPGGFLRERASGVDAQTPVADDKAHARHDLEHGESRSQRALEADRTGRKVAVFQSNLLDLAAGTSITLEGHPNAVFSRRLLVTETRISTTTYPSLQLSHQAHFTDEPYRPARATPKPLVAGIQSALVVGPANEEIHTDEFGRVRVHFPWDREGKHDDSALCWVRVSESWSGAGYGMICLPRVGQEVLIAFIGGDPDLPVVVGRLHNELNPVPYRLPENRTVSAWRTMSSPSNGGYSELKIEDKAGNELMYTRAQRDNHRLVLRDERTRVERALHHTVVADEHRVSKADKKELVVGTSHLHIRGPRNEKVDASASLVVGTDQDVRVGQKLAIEAGQEVHVKAGAKLILEAGARLTIKASGGFIDIHPGGIDIVGDVVRINSGGAAAQGSGASTRDPADAEEAEPIDTSLP